MMYLSNAFSLNMFNEGVGYGEISFVELSTAMAKDALSLGPWCNSVGHADTARLIGGLLGVELHRERVTCKLERNDQVVVAQYSGPRLPEGATELPEGAKIKFYLVSVLTLTK